MSINGSVRCVKPTQDKNRSVMLFLRYAWVLLLANGYLNVCLARWRVKDTIASYPELADGYRRLTRGFGILYALP